MGGGDCLTRNATFVDEKTASLVSRYVYERSNFYKLNELVDRCVFSDRNILGACSGYSSTSFRL